MMKSTSFSRTYNMTDEEKQAFLMFAGTMHGFAKQTDQMIMGQSVNLRPISTDIQNTFAQVLQAPTQPAEMHYQAPPEQPTVYESTVYEPTVYGMPVATPISEPIVGVEQAVKELKHIQQAIRPTEVSNNVDIIDVLKEINLNLARIATTLESHGGQKRTKSTKAA